MDKKALNTLLKRAGRNPRGPNESCTYLSIDTETLGLKVSTDQDTTFVVTAADIEGNVWCWSWKIDIHTRRPVDPDDVKEQAEEILKVIHEYDRYVFHNALFDMHALYNIGIKLPWDKIEDTMIAAHVLNNLDTKGLKPLAVKFFDISESDEEELEEMVRAAMEGAKKQGIRVEGSPKGNMFLIQDTQILFRYATTDAVRTIKLWDMFSWAIHNSKLEIQYELNMACLPAYWEAERYGMMIDPNCGLVDKLEQRYQAMKANLTEAYGINLESVKQMQRLLYLDWKLPIQSKTNTGQPSTRTADLKKLLAGGPDAPHYYDLEDILHYRQLKKAVEACQSYMDLADDNNVLHPNINPCGTDTTRSSSSKPNSQNVSKNAAIPLRSLFIPRPGHYLYSVDYKQQELRLVAHASQCELIQNALDSGEDLHQITADGLGIKRFIAKNTLFAWIYGGGTTRLAETAGVAVGLFKEKMGELYPELVRYMQQCIRKVKKDGYVSTVLGTPLGVPPGKAYAGCNYATQGSGGEVLKIGVVAWLAERNDLPKKSHRDETHLLAVVHDEIVFESTLPPDSINIKRLIKALDTPTAILGIDLPTDNAATDKNWGELE